VKKYLLTSNKLYVSFSFYLFQHLKAMSDIQPQDSVSNVGSSKVSTSSASKIAALKIKLAYKQKRARLQEERARLQEEQTIQRTRHSNCQRRHGGGRGRSYGGTGPFHFSKSG
jgi:hypothetical protein